MPVIVLILIAVFLGALSQRVTGMGFVLVSGPFIVLLLDPLSGVVLINIIGIVPCLIVLATTWREVDWRALAPMAALCVVGAFPGAWLAAAIPTAPLQILIGATIVAALLGSIALGRARWHLQPSRLGAGTAGFFAGVLNSAAGVGGPAISTYAVLTRWDHRSFAATMQPLLLIASVIAIIAKLTFTPDAMPHLGVGSWALIIGAIVVGNIVGELTAKRVPVPIARAGMIVIAMAGGLATLGKGLGVL